MCQGSRRRLSVAGIVDKDFDIDSTVADPYTPVIGSVRTRPHEDLIGCCQIHDIPRLAVIGDKDVNAIFTGVVGGGVVPDGFVAIVDYI